MWLSPQETTDLVTFTEEIFNEKLIFCLRSDYLFLVKSKKMGKFVVTEFRKWYKT